MRLHRLRSQLILAVILVVSTVVLVQLSIRIFVIYPEIKALSEKHQRHELAKVASQINQEFKSLENLVYDNAVWDETYNAIAQKDLAWFEKNYFLPASYETLGINGWFFFDEQKKLVAGEQFKLKKPLSAITPTIQKSGVLEHALASSFSTTDPTLTLIDGVPAALVASKILPSDEEGASNGIAVIIQVINQSFVDRITPSINDDIIFHHVDSLTNAELNSALDYDELVSRQDVTTAFNNSLNRLFITFSNRQKKPIFAVSILRPKGAKKNVIVDGSMLGGILFSVLALLVFYSFINRKLITPVYELLSLVKEAQTKKDFSGRGKATGNNELYELTERLNRLFSLIEDQQATVTQKNKILENLSRTDALTGLSNRRYFDEWMTTLASNESTTKTAISLLVIDIDFFKKFNDHYGHAKGDEALKLVAESIQQSLHLSTDHAFRYGGEEFTVVLQNTSLNDGITVAENIRRHIEAKRYEHVDSTPFGVITVSIGISAKEEGAELNEQALFKAADEGLYLAKEKGRNTVSTAS